MTLISKTQGSLLPHDVIRLVDIFNKLNWKLDTNDEQISNHRNIFDKFCNFLDFLNREERDLVLLLTEDFLHINFWNYPTLLKKALLEIPNDLIDSCENVYLTALISPKDIGKTKSSTSMLYGCLHEVIPNIETFNKKKPKSYDNPNLIDEKHKNRQNSLILLLDDFIGSGDTAIESINYFKENSYNESDTIIVVSLVAQIQGVLRIEEAGHKVFYANLRDRAISDSVRIKNKFRALKVIRNIEKRMGIEKNADVQKDYRLGYKRTQSLVSMIRTPNNTLPIYWWSKKPNGEKCDGIFRR